MVEAEDGACSVAQEIYDDAAIERVFGDKWNYLLEQQAERIGEVEAEKAGRAPVPDDLGEQLKQWWEPLMKRAP